MYSGDIRLERFACARDGRLPQRRAPWRNARAVVHGGLALVVAGAWATMLGAPPAFAGPSTAVADTCDAVPPSQATIARLLATPGPAAPWKMPVVASEAEFPQGTPASEAQASEASDLVGRYFACVNAGEVVRFYGLFSDHFLRTSALITSNRDLETAFVAFYPTAVATLVTPLPTNLRTTVVETRDARVLPDGRVGIVAVIHQPSFGPHQAAAFFALQPTPDGLRIDEIVLLGADAATPAATPAS